MKDAHTPDPEFVNHLEWELESAVRRQESLNGTSSARRPRGLRLGATLALVFVSMFVGGAGTHAVTLRADAQAAELYIARSEALLEIAETRLDHFAQELATATARLEQGQVTEREARQVEAHYSLIEAETEIRRLELAETLLTGKAPNDSLSAPLVDGRDFVTERLVAQRRPLQMQLQLANDQALRHQELSEAGMVAEYELQAAHAGSVAVERELAALEKRITLRESFLAGELSAAVVELQGMRATALAARVLAAHQVELAEGQHKRITMLAERNAVSPSELRAVQTMMATVQTQVKLAELELQIIDQKLEAAAEK